MLALSMPCIASGDDPARSAKRIQDAEDPYKTTPLPAAAARYVDKLERTTEQIERDQEKLKAGQIKREEYDKALADNKKQVAELAASLPQSAPVQTSAARASLKSPDTTLLPQFAFFMPSFRTSVSSCY
jgi:multidrug resistance efflux pump